MALPFSAPAAGVMRAATSCRATEHRAVSPTFRSSLPFGCKDTSLSPQPPVLPRTNSPSAGRALASGLSKEPSSGNQRFLQGNMRARIVPPSGNQRASRFLPDDLPLAPSEIIEDRGRRHFSPPVPREPKYGRALPYARDGCISPAAGGPSSPRAMSPGSPRNGSPGAPHRDSALVSALLHADELPAPPAASSRAASPHQRSTNVRGLIAECADADFSPEPLHTSRRRVSPAVRDERENRPRGKASAAQCFQAQLDSCSAGFPSHRLRSEMAMDGHGWGAMTAAKELEAEEDQLQLRSKLSPGSGKYDRQAQLLASQPQFSHLSCAELRNMGKILAEANNRVREAAQAPRCPSANLKPRKAPGASSRRAPSPKANGSLSPRCGARIPMARLGDCSPGFARGASSDNALSPRSRRLATVGRQSEKTGYVQDSHPSASSAPVMQAALVALRAEVATLMDHETPGHSREVSEPNYRWQQQRATPLVEPELMGESSYHPIERESVSSRCDISHPATSSWPPLMPTSAAHVPATSLASATSQARCGGSGARADKENVAFAADLRNELKAGEGHKVCRMSTQPQLSTKPGADAAYSWHCPDSPPVPVQVLPCASIVPESSIQFKQGKPCAGNPSPKKRRSMGGA